MSRPGASLFVRTAWTVAIAFLLAQFLTVAAVAWLVVLPMAQRSADDLASLVVVAAKTWVELPPGTRPDFEEELAHHHGLRLQGGTLHGAGDAGLLPYAHLLEAALERRMGVAVPVRVSWSGERWFWAEFRLAGRELRIGFPQSRLGVHPPLALLITAALALVVTLVTTMLLVRRLTGPLRGLADAAAEVGQGGLPRLPESGPREIAVLARSFNRMAEQVRELLENRTVMLAGVSHDLRTPLARMRLALELLPSETPARLSHRLRRDIAEMDRLLGVYLALARGTADEAAVSLNLRRILEELRDEADPGAVVLAPEVPAEARCQARPLALKRTLGNLLHNALRYGGKAATLALAREDGHWRVSVLDQGPGIAPEELSQVFQPFYRGEASRSPLTGGSGLGLAIAKRLADANGWGISLQNREGGGLRCDLRIPVA